MNNNINIKFKLSKIRMDEIKNFDTETKAPPAYEQILLL